MDNTNRSIYGFSSPFPLPFPFPSPSPFPNETPRRLPVHELQGVVSQSRLKQIVVYSFPSRASLPYPTIRELPDAFGFFSSFQPSVYSLSIDCTLFHFCFKAS